MYCILLTLEAAEADFQDLQTRSHASAWADLLITYCSSHRLLSLLQLAIGSCSGT